VVPYVNVVAHLYDIDEKGSARLVQRGAMAPAKSGAQQVSFALYPQDWLFEEGHRIGIHLSGSDDDWFSPGLSQTTVEVAGGSTTLPLLRYVREKFLEGGPSNGMNSSPFTVDDQTLEESTVKSDPPPKQRKRR